MSLNLCILTGASSLSPKNDHRDYPPLLVPEREKRLSKARPPICLGVQAQGLEIRSDLVYGLN